MTLKIYLAALFTAFILTFLMTPISKFLAIKIGAVAYPRDRDVHNKPMPRMGGMAIVFGFVISIIIFLPKMEGIEYNKILGIVFGVLILFLLGVLDDLIDIKAKYKLIIQIIAAIIVVYSGIRIEFISYPFAGDEILNFNSEWLSMGITIFWIVGVINAVNWIDGLDGLAAGVSSISAICLMVLAVLAGNGAAVVITISLVGSCIGFLPYNFNPAKIFMGDTGSMVIGFILAVSSILGLFKGYIIVALIVPIIVLGLPIFDATFAIVRRIANGTSPMKADKKHLHHRLLDKGYSQKKAVLTMYAISCAFGLLGILVATKSIYYGLGVFIILLFILKIVTGTSSNESDK